MITNYCCSTRIERNLLCCNMIAHRTVAGHSKTLADTTQVISSGRLWWCQSPTSVASPNVRMSRPSTLGHMKKHRSTGHNLADQMRVVNYSCVLGRRGANFTAGQ
jgi:hypothetical protein